jgi:iron complex outermembrane receptor protein
MKLDGGDLALALGGEFRRERQNYHQSQALADDIILGETSQGPDADFGHSRKVGGRVRELDAPVTKQVDLSLAARYEHYQATGSATSPKLGLKYMATPELLFRASAGTGFRAPACRTCTARDRARAATLADPVCMANDNDLTDCAWNWTTRSYSKRQAQAGASRQFSLGAVMEPTRNTNISLDYWNIQKKNLISTSVPT